MIFVGTMSCGEGDTQKCIEAISKQKHVDVLHKVIWDLPEKEAHNELWKAWGEAKQKPNCHLFIKIDADTVLAHDEVLWDIFNLFASNQKLTGVQAYIKDFYTDESIYGLNCFSSSVVFNETTDPLMCDRNVDTNHNIVLRGKDLPASLNPAAYHCFHSNEKQSFHYGLHRSLKGQKDILTKVKRAWIKNGDDRRLWALFGDKFSYCFDKKNGFNYNDKKFLEIFKFCEDNKEEFKKEIILNVNDH